MNVVQGIKEPWATVADGRVSVWSKRWMAWSVGLHKDGAIAPSEKPRSFAEFGP